MFETSDLCPLIRDFSKRYRTIERHQDSKAQSGLPGELLSSDAVPILILAIGEACAYATQGAGLATVRKEFTASESIYYEEVAQTIKDCNASTGLLHAQKMLLIGHYNALTGRGESSAEFFETADNVLGTLINKHGLLFESEVDDCLSSGGINVETDSHTAREIFRQRLVDCGKKMRKRECRLVVMAAWACLRLQRQNSSTDYKQTTGLWKIEGFLPTLFSSPGKDICSIKLPCPIHDGRTYDKETILFFYHAMASMERLLEQLHTGFHREDSRSLSGQAFRALLEGYKEDVNKWKAMLPNGLRWDEQPAQLLNLMHQRLQEMYSKTMSEIDTMRWSGSHGCQTRVHGNFSR
jgi:hypothetical protein